MSCMPWYGGWYYPEWDPENKDWASMDCGSRILGLCEEDGDLYITTERATFKLDPRFYVA